MILGSDKAKVDDGHPRQPLRNVVYPVEIHGETYNLHEIGIGEHHRNVDSAKATGNLYRLVADLSNAGGVNLLVYVVRCNKRPVQAMRKNYSLLYHGLCDSKVPVVIVVTGCENVEPTMDMWWIDNERSFTEAGMSFNAHACVCAFKGARANNGGYRNDKLVAESVEVLRRLVVQRCFTNGWKKVWRSCLQCSRLKNSLKYFQFSSRLTRRHPPRKKYSACRKQQLFTRASTITSEILFPIQKRNILSKQYAILESESRIHILYTKEEQVFVKIELSDVSRMLWN